jgi:cytosine deaminase
MSENNCYVVEKFGGVDYLINSGSNVTCAPNDMKNLFYPFGMMNLLEVFHIAAYAGYIMTYDLLWFEFEMPSYNTARLLHVADHGIVEGNTAILLILSANSIVDATRFYPSLVRRAGRVLVQSELHREVDPSIPV